MEKIIELANELKYTSLRYVDEEDVSDGKVFINSTNNIFMYQKTNANKTLYWNSKSEDNIQIHWASESKEKFFQGLKETISHIKETEIKTEKIFIEFIPEEFLEDMSSIGFKIVSEWVDFWSNDLSLIKIMYNENTKLRSLTQNEISLAGQVTRKCSGYSRGFTGESDKEIKEWIEEENSNVLVAEKENKIIGVCLVNLYGFDSEKGTVLWIRELAVDPEYHGNRIGHDLLAYAVDWGIKNGAKRSFLACDAENANAIRLYKDFNYRRKEERGQINMEIEL